MWDKTFGVILFLLLACLTCFGQNSDVGLAHGRSLRAGTTRAQAVATVRAILNRNASACKIEQVRGLTATRSRGGWRVAAKLVMSASGRPLNETAVWTVRSSDGEGVPADQLAAEIGNGCP